MPYGDIEGKSEKKRKKRDFNVRNRIQSVHTRTDKEIRDAILCPLSSHHDFAKTDQP